MQIFLIFGLVCAVWAGFARDAAVFAASSPWARTDHGAVRLIAEGSAVGDAQSVRLGLHFRMKPGWKIYWRAPGDAGFPPKPDWTGSQNLKSAQMSWPAPTRFSVLGLQTAGYKTETVLPITANLRQPGAPLLLRLKLSYLTCAEICVPYDADLALDLPAGLGSSDREAGLIATYAARVPGGEAGGLALSRAEVAVRNGVQTLYLDARSDVPFKAPDLFVEGPRRVSFAQPAVEMAPGGKRALLMVAVDAPAGAGAIAGTPLTFTLVDGARAVETALTPVAASPDMESGAGAGLGLMLLFALLGGVILNLMPCVLPVLSIKLLSVIGHGGAAPGRIRAGFLASAAGILASFLALGTLAVFLRAGGQAAGWGLQFQEPLFLAAMAVLLVLFAANLWGLFAIALPGRLATALGTAGPPANGEDGPAHLGGHFLTGAFATLLATPCSAPFLGTAVGFALTRGPLEIYAVFAALGLGLAAPYLLVAAFPAIARRLPRPGGWMITLRRVLALALIGTAIWLLTVLAAQTGWQGAAVAAGAMVGVLALLAMWRGPVGRHGAVRWGGVALLALAAVIGPKMVSGTGVEEKVAAARPAAGAIAWRPFDAAAIPRLVALGQTVFVDVTADWCVTCKVNKAAVLDRADIASRLSAPGVVAMRADWTRPDPAIAAYLKAFGRFGIPFNAVYGPAMPKGEALVEILSRGAVLGALDRAGARAAANVAPTGKTP